MAAHQGSVQPWVVYVIVLMDARRTRAATTIRTGRLGCRCSHVLGCSHDIFGPGLLESPCGETAGWNHCKVAGRKVGIYALCDKFQATAVGLAHCDHERAVGISAQLPNSTRPASPHLPAEGTEPGGAHACNCVIGEHERAEDPGQQVRRQQDIHARQWERRHFGDESIGLVLELGQALAGVHG
eukprot:scaffold29513_cov51-Phaeocystis_antarctica.AAC.2